VRPAAALPQTPARRRRPPVRDNGHSGNCIWTKPAYPILAKLDRLPVPLRGSLLTLRWREMDSNLQFRARRNLGIPLELN
jgi:hypothetical protein